MGVDLFMVFFVLLESGFLGSNWEYLSKRQTNTWCHR